MKSRIESMDNRREMKSERSKKTDKLTADTHREFLDMDTDEEEFGRQESPEIEEEVLPEPERPVFTEQEIIILVQHVKNLVVLPALKDSDWNEACEEVIREYFENPSHLILTIFYRENVLTASLDLPEYVTNGLTYFSRSPWQIYTADNFLSTVSFGTINGTVKKSILKFIKDIYAPIALTSDDWPQIIKNDVFLSLHEFLVSLTEEVYNPLGLTVLYVPREGLLNKFENSSNKIAYFTFEKGDKTALTYKGEEEKEFVKRLEKIVWYWIRQMRDVMKTIPARKDIKSILDEVNYWKATHTNLNCLRKQLCNEDIGLIIQVLKYLRSPSVESYQELMTKVQLKLDEVSSNITYLKVLAELCENLSVPSESNSSVTQALLVILFTWAESPFYNTRNNMETICRALSTQIIYQCKEYIKLDVALGSNPESGIEMLEKCILCCNAYKQTYKTLVTHVIPRINSNRVWDVNEEEVFNSVDTFKQRCYDVIDVCQALIVFGKCNKIGTLGGPRGTEHEAYCRKIQSLFYESLDRIIRVRDIIFDVTQSSWLQQIRKFRNTVVYLENMAISLINGVFDDVEHIEEGIEAMYALHKFGRMQSLQQLLQKKWIQIWHIFYDDVVFCYTGAIDEIEKCDRSVQFDVKTNVKCIMEYLRMQYNIMINASDWIGDCPAEKTISEKYKRVVNSIDCRMETLYNNYTP